MYRSAPAIFKSTLLISVMIMFIGNCTSQPSVVPARGTSLNDDSTPEPGVPMLSNVEWTDHELDQMEYYRSVGFPYSLRYAVDVDSSLWRTGEPDPVIFDVPENIRNGLRENPELAMTALAVYLSEGSGIHGPAQDAFHLAKRIHDWITLNVAYDSSAVDGVTNFLERQDPSYFFVQPQGPVAVCRGMADLFEILALEAGLNAERVSGVGRSYWSSLGRLGTHAWNVLHVDGVPYIIDCSADSRISYTDSGWGEMRRYNDSHFLIAPETQLLLYRANEEDKQYISEPLGFDEFIEMPRVNMEFLQMGLAFRNQENLENRQKIEVPDRSRLVYYDLYSLESEPLEINFRSPGNVEIYATMTDEQGETIPYSTQILYEENPQGGYDETLLVLPPASGLFKVNLRARLSGNSQSLSLYSFYVQRTGDLLSNETAVLPRPDSLYPMMEIQATGVNVELLPAMEGRTVLDIDNPRWHHVFIRVETAQRDYFPQAYDSVRTEDGKTRYFISPPGEGLYFVRIYAQPFGEEFGNQMVAVMAIDSQGPMSPGRPELEVNYLPLYFDRPVSILEGLAPVPGRDRLYSIKLGLPPGAETRNYLLECGLDGSLRTDEDGDYLFVQGHYSKEEIPGGMEYFFSPGIPVQDDSRFVARIYLREEGRNKILMEFYLEPGEGPGDLAP